MRFSLRAMFTPRTSPAGSAGSGTSAPLAASYIRTLVLPSSLIPTTRYFPLSEKYENVMSQSAFCTGSWAQVDTDTRRSSANSPASLAV